MSRASAGEAGSRFSSLDDAYCALDKHLVGREDATAIIIIVLKPRPHMATEQQCLHRRGKLRRPNRRDAKQLRRKQADQRHKNIVGVRHAALEVSISTEHDIDVIWRLVVA